MDKNNYLKLNYRPKKQQEIIATFYIESKLPLEKVATEIAAESSIGTWTKVTTLTSKIFKKLSAKVFYLSKKNKIIKIAYPLKLFEPNNIPQLLSSIGVNIFSMKIIKNLRLVDIELPEKYINSFLGPKFGLKGVRKILKVKKRPLLGAIMKPKVGLNSKANAQLSYKLWQAGADIIKDDENLTDLSFNRFRKRVELILNLQKQLEKKIKKKKIYVFNITAPPGEMLQRAKYVKKRGGKCVMIDIISTGLDNVQYLRESKLDLIIHGHRAGHSIFTRNSKHGISMLVVAKLARLAGIDQLHTGTVVGKMEGEKEEVLEINSFLKSKFGSLKSVLPISSGGLHPGLIPRLVNTLGNDLIINFGGGLHGHPEGSVEGTQACYQAIEATTKKISLLQYAKEHRALKIALKHWV